MSAGLPKTFKGVYQTPRTGFYLFCCHLLREEASHILTVDQQNTLLKALPKLVTYTWERRGFCFQSTKPKDQSGSTRDPESSEQDGETCKPTCAGDLASGATASPPLPPEAPRRQQGPHTPAHADPNTSSCCALPGSALQKFTIRPAATHLSLGKFGVKNVDRYCCTNISLCSHDVVSKLIFSLLIT